MILVAWIGTIYIVPRPVLVSFLLLAALVAALRYPASAGLGDGAAHLDLGGDPRFLGAWESA